MNINKNIGITILGDSIIKNKTDKYIYDWSALVKIKLQNKFAKKIFFKIKTVHGLNSRELLNLLPNFFLRIDKKFKDYLIIQIGINDSWYYKSLNGIACVPPEEFSKNLKLINKISKIYKFKKIIFVNYHKISINRFEGNNKTPNQNLQKYNALIKKFCIKNNLDCINAEKHTKKHTKICLPIPDGVHLNKKGVRIYSDLITKVLYKKIND